MVAAPQTIGRYTLARKLGKGGMGVVYKALLPSIEKVVAIKVLDPSEALEITLGTEELESIFLTEARTLSALNHRHIAAIWDFDRDDQGRPYFVMEYYCNNLGDMIGEQFVVEEPSRQIRPEKVLYYGLQILDALEYLHYHRVIHRDIKPHNILVTDHDTIKICDFGMALVNGVSFTGPDNMQVGSPCYAPPEQKKSPHSVDGRADCYSTAVLLYRMLTGTLPGMQSFPLSLINPAYDHRWDEFFRVGLSWDPNERFQSARLMKQAFEKLFLHSRETANQEDQAEQTSGPITLRSTPDNQCGARARSTFGITKLHRPQKYISNDFSPNVDTVKDFSTGLIWQRSGSPYPKNWNEALLYIDLLNRSQFGGIDTWRLPTIEELQSLLDGIYGPTDESIFPSAMKWIWSCDLHGKNERWYINLDMGFVASQDMDCRNFVRAVSSLK